MQNCRRTCPSRFKMHSPKVRSPSTWATVHEHSFCYQDRIWPRLDFILCFQPGVSELHKRHLHQ